MDKIKYFAAACALICACVAANAQGQTKGSLKSAFEGKFYIGTALDLRQIYEKDRAAVDVIKEHFNSVVAENCMKSGPLHPKEDRYYWKDADAFVDFGEKNGMQVIGHCLIWHSQAPAWFFTDEKGDDVSPDVLKQRMKDHIFTVMTRYKGRISGWDVVNEAINDDGTLRESKFYKILGREYLKLAFLYAHEADPDAELYYNDFSMAKKPKRDKTIEIVNWLKSEGCRVDAIGMQGHCTMTFPKVKDFEASVAAFAQTGCKVMITEFDLSILPDEGHTGANLSDEIKSARELDPYVKGLPGDVYAKWEKRVMEFFDVFVRHSDNISRVTLWGVNDRQSWRNNFPVRGRTDYALLFDRKSNPKPVVQKLIDKYKNE